MEKDITTKALLENNDVFADIANVNIFKGEKILHSEELENISIHTSYRDAGGKHRELFRDVLKKAKNLGGCIAFIGYENQTGISNIMPVRNMGYTYTSYMSQIREMIAENKEKEGVAYAKGIHDDQKLFPVVTFVLYFGKEPWESPRSLMDMLMIPEDEKDFWSELVTDYPIHVISMANQPEEVRKQYQSDYGVIADYLAYQSDWEGLKKHLRQDKRKLIHTEQVLEMLEALSGDKRFEMMRKTYIQNEEKEECDRMCLLLDMCEEEGMQKGVQKGMQDGILLTKLVFKRQNEGLQPEEIAKAENIDLELVLKILE